MAADAKVNEDETMPEVLKKFLNELSAGSTDLVWEYLDGNPDAIKEMIEVLRSNPT